MPPKARGGQGGRGRKSSGAQTGPIVKDKVQLSVREAFQQQPLFQDFQSPEGLKQMEDRIILFRELLPFKLREKSVTLDTGYTLLNWYPSANSSNSGVLQVRTSSGTILPLKAYQKRIALLEPYRWMKYKERPSQPFFWQFSGGDISAPENQGYIDVLGSYLVSKLATTLHSPHFCGFYGAFRAVASCFLYNLEDDLEDFRFTKWFWEGLDTNQFGIRVVEKSTGRVLSRKEVHELLRPDAELLTNTSESDSDSDSDDICTTDDETSSLGAESIPAHPETSAATSNLEGIDLEEAGSFTSEPANETIRIRKGPGSIHTVRTMSTASDETAFDEDYTVHAELYDMPVAVMFLEQMEGTMDECLEQKLYTPIKTEEQKEIWRSWLFQVCAALTQIQGSLNLTHNDLHTNNVLWKKTEQDYLWYKSTIGQVYRVPTFGRIFTIIDYGRAIFTLNGHTCISSDYDDGHDAAGMYNFGLIEDKELPRVYPCKSFDLCRLACSLLRAMYPQNPTEKVKGRVLSKEGEWTVKETVEELYNLLWVWLTDAKGENVLETEEGDEKYPGFDLYQVIAATVKSAVPEDQLKKAIFAPFQWKGDIPVGTVASIL